MLQLVSRAARPRFALAALLGLCLCLAWAGGAPPAIAQESDAALAPGSAAVVAEATLLRGTPDYAAAVLTPLDPGTPVDVVGGPITDPTGTRWYLVTAVGQTGYLPTGALAPSAALAEAAAEPPAEAPVESTDALPAPEPESESPAEAPVDSAELAPEVAPPAEPPAEAPVEPAAVGPELAAPPVADPLPDLPAATATATATATALLNLRAGPSYDDDVLRVLPPGAPATVNGPATAGFLPVVYDDTAGWVDAAYLDTGGASPPLGEPILGDAADAGPVAPGTIGPVTATEPLNLRVGPSFAAPVVVVIPAGAALETTGDPQQGFSPVRFGDQSGWANADFLEVADSPAEPAAEPPSEADATPAPAADAAPVPEIAAPPASGAGLVFPFAGGTWQVIQGYNNGTHTFRGATSDYRYSLDWARADGDTAGQPIYAPVSGTIRWVGNGGMLIDAGNGYGVAMFHVTYDGFSSGQSVQQGQRLGVISGPGGPGYAGTPHVDLTLWQLGDGANVSTPFTGANAIAGQDFPDAGTANQHMGATAAP